MHTQLSGIGQSRKSIFAALISLTLLLAMLPFAAAHSGDTMNAPPATVTPTIDGINSPGEWTDASSYSITGPGGTSTIYIKYDASNLYILIDSPWDTTPAVVGWMDNTWTAFDTSHNGGTAPQTDDYLFNSQFTSWNYALKGTGTGWTVISPPAGYSAVQSYASGNKLDEIQIPLAYVCAAGAGGTAGFYVLVIDDSSDPDGWGPLPATRYVEWPPAAGGDPAGWPPTSDPCPTGGPDVWGDLTLTVPVYRNLGITSVTPNVTTVVQGGVVNVAVVVTNDGTTTESTQVNVFYLPAGTGVWGTWFDQQSVSLGPGASTTLYFDWDTSWISPGDYQIRAGFPWGWSDDNPGDDTALSGAITVQPPPPIIAGDLIRRSAWPEHHHYDISSDADPNERHGTPGKQTLYARVGNTGTDTLLAGNYKVVFAVTDQYGDTVPYETVGTVDIPVGGYTDLTYDLDASLFSSTEKTIWDVSAQVYYDADGDGFFESAGAKIKTFGFHAVP